MLDDANSTTGQQSLLHCTHSPTYSLLANGGRCTSATYTAQYDLLTLVTPSMIGHVHAQLTTIIMARRTAAFSRMTLCKTSHRKFSGSYTEIQTQDFPNTSQMLSPQSYCIHGRGAEASLLKIELAGGLSQFQLSYGALLPNVPVTKYQSHTVFNEVLDHLLLAQSGSMVQRSPTIGVCHRQLGSPAIALFHLDWDRDRNVYGRYRNWIRE